VPPVKKCPRA